MTLCLGRSWSWVLPTCTRAQSAAAAASPAEGSGRSATKRQFQISRFLTTSHSPFAPALNCFSLHIMWPFSSSPKQPQEPQSSAFVDPSSSSSSSPSPASPQPQPSQPSQSQDPSATAYFSTHQFASPSASPSHDPNYTPSASDIFSGQGFDAARLNPFSGLGKDEVEYLDIVDNQPNQIAGARTVLPGRGWSDDLSYGTGTTYLSGLVLGGTLGAREGFFRPLGVDNPTFRLRLNATLNQMTRRASFMGNSAGVIALIYNSIDAIIDNVRGVHDMPGAIAAGALSGALFKVTAGPRPMLVASSIMAAAAASWTAAKQALA